MTKREVRPTLIAASVLGFDDGLCFGERGEMIRVQALVSGPTVKRFDKSIVTGLPGRIEGAPAIWIVW